MYIELAHRKLSAYAIRTLREMLLAEQLRAQRRDLVDARLVSVQFLFEVLVLLHFAVQVGRVQVRVVRRELQLLVDPACGLRDD